MANNDNVIEQVSIQWFPGHMAKTRRLMKSNLSLVDLVVEIIDARIPLSSRNPEMSQLVGKKPRLVLLNKCDAADEKATNEWCKYYKSQGVSVLPTDCRSGKGLKSFYPAVREILSDVLERRRQKGMIGKPIRIMVVGIPNVGKSSLINRLAGQKRAKVEDRPGVTRGKQWVSLDKGIDLLDMPGVLWPKFEDRSVGEKLAFTGAVKDDILDTETLAGRLLEVLREKGYLPLVCTRYKLNEADLTDKNGIEMLEAVGRKRGMLISGGEVDIERAAIMLLDEFRSGKIGRITLDLPQDEEKNENA